MRNTLYILLTFLIVSCSTGRITTTETKPNEAIIFGKLTFENSQELENKKILMHFNERLWGKYAVWLDDNGYFYMKLPLEKNHIALLEYREGIGFYKNIPENYISINIPDSDKIYYVGDIAFTWTPKDEDKRKQGGATGAIIEAKQDGNNIPVTINSTETTINYFRQKFPNNKKEIVTKLMIKEQ
mgnify:CR=1 FL=1